jgi:phenylpropionate dioxygenase-like ring-hydroxylating dioxygenase large terminal subunit
LRAVRIIGDNLVLYRTESGEAVALEDACPHRKLPLSMGRIMGDEVECGYHGLVFDRAGRCTRIPGVKRVPSSVGVRCYPAVSLYGLVWIWMGDPSLARAETIVAIDHWTDPSWGRNQGGSMTVDCNYLYVTDNLLDPSHVAWVHRTSFGNEERVDEPVQTTVSAAGVVAARWLRDVEVAPFYAPLVGFDGRCDRLQHYEVRFPSHAIIRALFVPAGTGGHGRPLHEKAFVMDSYNFITPVDADHSRYFWFQMRNFSPGDQRVSKIMDDAVREAFAEDRVILNAVHRGFVNQATPNIDLAIDRAPLQFRRALGGLIASEQPSAAGAVFMTGAPAPEG